MVLYVRLNFFVEIEELEENLIYIMLLEVVNDWLLFLLESFLVGVRKGME